MGKVIVTVDDKGQITIAYSLTAKGASVTAGGLVFLPQDQNLEDLSPEDLRETAIDPNAALAYTASLDSIPQSGGVAMLCLNLLVDYDIYAEGVHEYQPEEE